MDTKQDRDDLQSALMQTQQVLDAEVAAKDVLQSVVNQLNEKLSFQQQLYDKVPDTDFLFCFKVTIFSSNQSTNRPTGPTNRSIDRSIDQSINDTII